MTEYNHCSAVSHSHVHPGWVYGPAEIAMRATPVGREKRAEKDSRSVMHRDNAHPGWMYGLFEASVSHDRTDNSMQTDHPRT